MLLVSKSDKNGSDGTLCEEDVRECLSLISLPHSPSTSGPGGASSARLAGSVARGVCTCGALESFSVLRGPRGPWGLWGP